jgi:hypothetical protein
MIGAGRDVLEGAGPTAAVVAEAPVFEIPCGEAVGGEIGGDWAYEIQSDGAVVEFSELGDPAASVNNDDNGMRPSAGRDAQLAEWQHASTVSNASGVGDGKFQEVVRGSFLSKRGAKSSGERAAWRISTQSILD